MQKKLRATYTLRPEEIIQMLHKVYIKAFLTATVEAAYDNDESWGDDEEPIPMDHGGPETTAWIKLQAEKLKQLKRRKDGTFYVPRVTPNTRICEPCKVEDGIQNDKTA